MVAAWLPARGPQGAQEGRLPAVREQEQSASRNLVTVWLLVIIIIMLCYAVFGERGVLRILQAEKQKRQLELQLQEIKQDQQRLRAEIERLRSDKDYWEQLARTKLGMVREGELIYHLPPREPQTRGDKPQ